MALPNTILPGFSASLYMQQLLNPVPLSNAELSNVTFVGPLAVSTNLVPVEEIPAFGQDDAVASFSVAGSRQSDKIPTQSAPTSMTITAAWNPSNPNLLLIRSDAYSGVVDRTFVISATSGSDTVYYAFNGRVSQFNIDPNPTAEAKCTFTIHPRGNQYGWCNNT